MPRLSAVDAVSPAFENTTRLLFKPFRFKYWLRVGLLGILTGELGGSGFNFNLPSNTNWHPQRHFAGPVTAVPDFAKYALLIVAGVALFMLLGLVFALLHGVYRFVLFETVLGHDVSLVAGWKRWFDKGMRYFGWMLLLQFVFLIAIAVFAGGPVLGVLAAGGFSHGVTTGAVLAIVWAVFACFALMILFLLVFVFSKDFVVPMMALEDLSFTDAWRRLWAETKGQKGSFAAYVGMKIVLSIAGGIFFGIVAIILMLIFAIPVAIVVFLLIGATHSGSIVWSVQAIVMAAAAGLVVLLGYIYSAAVAGSPITIFFPSYGLYFLAGRYPPLERIMFPAPPGPMMA